MSEAFTLHKIKINSVGFLNQNVVKSKICNMYHSNVSCICFHLFTCVYESSHKYPQGKKHVNHSQDLHIRGVTDGSK